jgi:hypothetical protein
MKAPHAWLGVELGSLPPSVELMTLQTWPVSGSLPGSVLIRLVHNFAIGEDAALSKPVNVSLVKLFPAPIQVQTTTLFFCSILPGSNSVPPLFTVSILPRYRSLMWWK